MLEAEPGKRYPPSEVAMLLPESCSRPWLGLEQLLLGFRKAVVRLTD